MSSDRTAFVKMAKLGSKEHDYAIFSRDRHADASYSPSKFSIQVPKMRYVHSAQLTELIIRNTLYNITSTNNIIRYDDGGGPASLVIPNGNYSPEDLVQAIIDEGGLGLITVVYNAITMKMEFTSMGAHTLLWSFANTMYDILGFEAVDTASQAINISTEVVDMNKEIHQLFIQISEVGSPHDATGGLNNYTYQIPLGPRGALTRFHEDYENDSQVVHFHPQGFSTLDVKVLNSRGQIVELNGQEWMMILNFHYIPRT